MDKLADIGTHDWKSPELSWREESYLTGGIFNSPKEKWPVLPVRSFMKQDMSNLPFLREKIIQVNHPESDITCCFRTSESSEEELPKVPKFWHHMSLYQDLDITVNSLMICTLLFRRKRNQRQGEVMEPMPLVEIKLLS